jgi:hydrogenase/urease accessory protein HupE
MHLKLVQLVAGAVLIASLSLPWWRHPPIFRGDDSVVATGWQDLAGGDHIVAIATAALMVAIWLPWTNRDWFAAALTTVAALLAMDVVRYAATGPECKLNDLSYTPQSGLYLAIAAALVLLTGFVITLRRAIQHGPRSEARVPPSLERWHAIATVPAAIAVLVSLSLPWYGFPYDSADESESGWSVFAGADVLLTCVAILWASQRSLQRRVGRSRRRHSRRSPVCW